MNNVQAPALLFSLHKPAGPTSYDVVHTVKKLLGKQARKIGHFGTLDPFANGLIIVGTGGATRLADRFHDQFPKTYRAVGKLGIKMDTGDSTGDEIERAVINACSRTEWQQKAQAMVGEYWQRPPAFSAAKHEGKALYEYARRGIVIEKEPVRRFIHELTVENVNEQEVTIVATVSGGTYIRTLFEDLAKSCGNLGHLRQLTRTRIGDLTCPEEHGALNQWNLETLEQHWLSIDSLLPSEKVVLEGRDLELFGHGQCLTRPRFSTLNGPVWVTRPDGEVVALGEVQDNVLKSAVMFAGGSPAQKPKLLRT